MNNLIRKNFTRKFILLGAVMLILISATACQQLDAVGKNSITSFEKVLNEIPDNVKEVQDLAWSMEAPDASARFVWSKDFNKTEYDAYLEFEAAPFIAAGLDTSLLPDGMIQEEKIIAGLELGDDVLSYNGEITPLSSYEQFINLSRDNIGYHAALDHFGIDLGDGNMFEWAKDMDTNDKDIVFVLNPEVFINAGVNPEEVEGWAFAKVETMDKSGKKVEIDKFLKPFGLQ